jgi:hypothetical protein
MVLCYLSSIRLFDIVGIIAIRFPDAVAYIQECINMSIGIRMRKQQTAIIVLAIWLTIISIIMIVLQQADLEIFFVLFLIGVLVIVYFMESNFVQPNYVRYLRVLITLGIVIFSAIVAQKIMNLLGLEFVFV